VFGAVLLAVAVLLALGATSLAWRQVRRASATIGGDQLRLGLKRLPLVERLGELGRRAEPGSWEHQLAVEALAAPDQAAQVAIVNLALADAEHTLSEGAAWPSAGVRIALLGAGLLAAAAYITDADQVRWWLSILAVGCIAALACFEASRSARRHADQRRRGIDELVAITFGDGSRGGAQAGGDTVPRRTALQRRRQRQAGRRF